MARPRPRRIQWSSTLRKWANHDFDFSEQVHVRGFFRRGLRLELVAGLGIALAVPAMSVVAASAQSVGTTTALTLGAQSGCTQVLTIAVTATNSQTAAGAVAIEDNLNGSQVQLASVALSAQGTASATVSLTDGPHTLTAVYAGNTTFKGSTSSSVTTGNIAGECEFTVSTSPSTLSLLAGQSGTVIASVSTSADFTSTLSAPVFVTLSCSGLPDQATCTFTPESVEILPTTTAALTSSMVIGTQAASASLKPHPQSNPVAWALLLPGMLGLGGLAWGARHRAWLNRLALLALVGLVTVLGATACAPRYNYYNHGPPVNPATPAGTYTVFVTAQSTNGITAVTTSTTMAVTVTE